MTLIEARAHGIPCVAFRCETGPSEIIADGYDGALVPALNTKAFSDQLSSLIEDQEKRRLYGQRAKEATRKFDTELVLECWDKQVLLDA